MNAPVLDFSGRSLLAVFAHPDDESIASGGLLALCARYGATVSLLCLTRGELDQGRPSPVLGQTRADELQAAAAVLGVTDITLSKHEDGMLPWVDPAILETDILNTIGRLRPEVVVTFGNDGLYWHPDHIAVHERTTAAVATMDDDAPALYYVTIPPGQMRALIDHVAEAQVVQGGALSHHVLGVSDADAFGAMAATPTLVVDATALASRKLAALRCHVTQTRGGVLEVVGEREAGTFLGIEHYRRADVGAQASSFIELLSG